MIRSNWVLTVPLSKTEETDGRWLVQGLVSGPGVDAQGDNVTAPAIDRLISRLNERPVPLRNFHKGDSEPTIILDMGTTVSATKTDEGDALVEIELDQDNPEAQYLWKKLDKGKQFGLSIHGPAEATFEWDSDAQKRVMNIHDVDMDHIGITTRPAFVKSLGTVVRKSLEDADLEVSNLSDETVDTTVSKAEEAVDTTAPVVTDDSQAEAEVVVSKTQEDFASLAKQLIEALKSFDVESTTTETPASSEETVPPVTEKSMSETTDDIELLVVVKSLKDEITAVKASLDEVRQQIPGTTIPDAVVSKSSEQELRDTLAGMRPEERIHFGLAMLHGEK